MQTSDIDNLFRAESDMAKDHARGRKAEQLREFGSPVMFSGKVLALKIKNDDAWTAESGHIVRRTSLESGKTLQIYKGHSGPVTCFDFYDHDYLVTGSWDKTIRVWNTTTKTQLSSTAAHNDFVKALLVIPSLSLLVSSSSDKIIRFWDLSTDLGKPLVQLGSLAAHTRPVEAMAVDEKSAVLYTTDSMGTAKSWQLERTYDNGSGWRASIKAENTEHRTGISDVWAGGGFLWTASKDETVLIQTLNDVKKSTKTAYSISHSTAVNAILPLSLTSLDLPYLLTASGDVLRLYSFDIENPAMPDLICQIDGHWDNITAVGYWLNNEVDSLADTNATWILTAGLDGTLRRWKLADMLDANGVMLPPKTKRMKCKSPELTEEEERELAELMEE